MHGVNLAEDFAPVQGSREWVKDAACAKPYAATLYDAWFGPAEDDPGYKGTVIPHEYRVEAFKSCRACPVRDECLEYALRNDIRHGIWGGLAPEIRTKLRNAAKAAA